MKHLCPVGVFHFWLDARTELTPNLTAPSGDLDIRFCPDHDEPPQSEGPPQDYQARATAREA